VGFTNRISRGGRDLQHDTNQSGIIMKYYLFFFFFFFFSFSMDVCFPLRRTSFCRRPTLYSSCLHGGAGSVLPFVFFPLYFLVAHLAFFFF
jgi:hypothetical protein